MRAIHFLLTICFATCLSAQTIDQKLEKLAAKGYINKDYIPSIKQVILLKNDTVTEASVLTYLYTGDQNFNSSGVLKDELTKMKKAFKPRPNKVLKDMHEIGMIEKDSTIAWIKGEMKNDSAIGLMKMIDIFNYLNVAGQYEDAVKPYRISALLYQLDSLQLITPQVHKELMERSAKHQLNNLLDVFVQCQGAKLYNTTEAHDVVKGLTDKLTELAKALPELDFKNVEVVRKVISTVTDSVYVTLQCGKNTYRQNFSIFSGNYEWKQVEEKNVYQVINKALVGAGSVKRIYEVTIDNKIGGANNVKILWPISATQHYQLQQFQRTKEGNVQLFKFFPN